jgi:hypothetical protein
MDRSKLGRTSCLVFGLVLACLTTVAFLQATMPPPSGGGEFRGLNNLGRGMLMVALLLFSTALAPIGCALGMIGLMKQRENSNAATAGLALNFLAAGALILWWLSQ